MKNMLMIAVAGLALMACEKETINPGAEKAEIAAANAAKAPKVVLPPSITATKTYRCADSSVVYVDWLSDKLSANFRTADSGTAVQLKAAVAGEALTAEGYSLTGTDTSSSITIERPNMPSQSCKS